MKKKNPGVGRRGVSRRPSAQRQAGKALGGHIRARHRAAMRKGLPVIL
ncbi:MAG: hypothetical protein Q8Q08_03985 [Candidatus Omnitrophota bacterium]|nr:hypothetical protein [Candidatus Omnitrophota bacterium]